MVPHNLNHSILNGIIIADFSHERCWDVKLWLYANYSQGGVNEKVLDTTYVVDVLKDIGTHLVNKIFHDLVVRSQTRLINSSLSPQNKQKVSWKLQSVHLLDPSRLVARLPQEFNDWSKDICILIFLIRLSQIGKNQLLLEILVPVEFFSVVFIVENLFNFLINLVFDWSQLLF